ncbi:MAG: hypothetical protein KBB83_08610 [Alphaproteobacteria bacterium]|nr:hypothetical protein [Alphaproteobacteria bacterium]
MRTIKLLTWVAIAALSGGVKAATIYECASTWSYGAYGELQQITGNGQGPTKQNALEKTVQLCLFQAQVRGIPGAVCRQTPAVSCKEYQDCGRYWTNWTGVDNVWRNGCGNPCPATCIRGPEVNSEQAIRSWSWEKRCEFQCFHAP